MTFTYPYGMTYAQMCIFIDENAYSDNPDHDTIYSYLYHIMYMLARKARFYNTHHMYDYYALFSANRLYFRLFNPKQYQFNEDGSPKMTKLTSILNYAKKLMYVLKLDFEQSEYCQTISKEVYPDTLATYNFETILANRVDSISANEFNLSLLDIARTCRKFIDTIPKKKSSAEWLNIYTSVMLTFINHVTMTNKQKARLNHLRGTRRLTESHIDSVYASLSNDEPILFHLDESYKDYITILTNQLKLYVNSELNELIKTNMREEALTVGFTINEYMYGETVDEY